LWNHTDIVGHWTDTKRRTAKAVFAGRAAEMKMIPCGALCFL
jgi:hypothetical protein